HFLHDACKLEHGLDERQMKILYGYGLLMVTQQIILDRFHDPIAVEQAIGASRNLSNLSLSLREIAIAVHQAIEVVEGVSPIKMARPVPTQVVGIPAQFRRPEIVLLPRLKRSKRYEMEEGLRTRIEHRGRLTCFDIARSPGAKAARLVYVTFGE